MAKTRAHHNLSPSATITDPGEVARHAAQLRGAEKSRVLKAAAVPLPALDDIALVRSWSAGREKRFLRNIQYNVQLWNKHTPTYRILNADIDILSSRPKPSNEGKIEAQKTIDAMVNWQADACSAKFCDENGQPVAAYFAKRIERRSAGQRRVGMVSASLTVASCSTHLFALRKRQHIPAVPGHQV